MKKLLFSSLIAAGLATVANADVSVAWTAPPNGSGSPVGTCVAPIGQATASGSVGGDGLDLALVLDSSGSMVSVPSGQSKSLQVLQREAAIALVNALPEGTTSVTVIEFDEDANTAQVLTALSSDKAAVIAAINSVDANGGTNIGLGIDEAAA